MYFPIVRGFVPELLALNACIQKGLLSTKVVPVIEPVRDLSLFFETVETFIQNRHPLGLILNPSVGSLNRELLREQHRPGKDFLRTRLRAFLESGSVLPALHVTEHMNETVGSLEREELSVSDCIFLYKARNSLDFYKEHRADNAPRYSFVPDRREFRRHRASSTVLCEDVCENVFHRQERNVDYLDRPSDFFSADHRFFREEGYAGFADYSFGPVHPPGKGHAGERRARHGRDGRQGRGRRQTVKRVSLARICALVLCAGLLTLCGVRPALAESAAVQAQDGSTLVRLSRISVDPARLAACALTAGLAGTGLAGESLAKGTVMAAAPSTSAASSPSTVLFTPQVTAERLVALFEALHHPLKAKVGIKISFGEPGGHYFLNPALIAPLVHRLDGTLVECCTAYKGGRLKAADHWKTIEAHGFRAIAPCDLMDEEGDMALPVRNGLRLETNFVGRHLDDYASLLILSHFKGHSRGGFGGALKYMSIGIASTRGKSHIHTGGATTDYTIMMQHFAEQRVFLECMAEACKAVMDHKGRENIVYINVANNLSVDCDCDAHPARPEMADLGIFASTDPIALDQACYDAVVQARDPGKASLIERMDSRQATHILEAGERLGLGSRRYTLTRLA